MTYTKECARVVLMIPPEDKGARPHTPRKVCWVHHWRLDKGCTLPRELSLLITCLFIVQGFANPPRPQSLFVHREVCGTLVFCASCVPKKKGLHGGLG